MNRSEIWLINLEPTLGAEIRKTRPAVIVNADQLGKLPLRIIVPITDWKEQYAIAPWMVKLNPTSQNGLSKTSTADCFQVRSIAQTRFVRKIGTLPEAKMEEILRGLSAVLQIQ